MIRTQIQLPDPLYKEVKQVAKTLDWSIAEVLRRGAEYIVNCYQVKPSSTKTWIPPKPRKLGKFLSPPEQWRQLANEKPLST